MLFRVCLLGDAVRSSIYPSSGFALDGLSVLLAPSEFGPYVGEI